jgi:hypothetical protein
MVEKSKTYSLEAAMKLKNSKPRWMDRGDRMYVAEVETLDTNGDALVISRNLGLEKMVLARYFSELANSLELVRIVGVVPLFIGGQDRMTLTLHLTESQLLALEWEEAFGDDKNWGS